jgi:F-type H+-transporting ATPase subunit epsilon
VAKAFSLKVVTPAGSAVEAEVESLVLPGAAGSLGVLASHEPWTVLLTKGAVSYKKVGGAWEHVDIGGGVASIEGTRTVVLADS